MADAGVGGVGGEPVSAAALHSLLLHTFTPDGEQRKVRLGRLFCFFFGGYGGREEGWRKVRVLEGFSVVFFFSGGEGRGKGGGRRFFVHSMFVKRFIAVAGGLVSALKVNIYRD